MAQSNVCIYECMNECMYVFMNEWIYVCIYVFMYKWMYYWMNMFNNEIHWNRKYEEWIKMAEMNERPIYNWIIFYFLFLISLPHLIDKAAMLAKPKYIWKGNKIGTTIKMMSCLKMKISNKIEEERVRESEKRNAENNAITILHLLTQFIGIFMVIIMTLEMKWNEMK